MTLSGFKTRKIDSFQLVVLWTFESLWWTYIFLGKVNEILQVDVIAVGLDIVVDEKVELVFDPVFEDEGEDPRSQLQEEDQTQEHGKLGSTWRTQTENNKPVTSQKLGESKKIMLESYFRNSPHPWHNFPMQVCW